VVNTDEEIKTHISREVLKKYCEELPDCSTFLENFFLTCGHYSPLANFLNYIMDLKLYSTTNVHINRNRERLVDAFFDIVEI